MPERTAGWSPTIPRPPRTARSSAGDRMRREQQKIVDQFLRRFLGEYSPKAVGFRRQFWMWHWNFYFKIRLLGKRKTFRCCYCKQVFDRDRATLEHVTSIADGGG